LHGHLNALFGDLLPQPFHSVPLRGDLEVLGYCQSDEAVLRQQAETFAHPLVLDSVKRLASKAMPSAWRPGQRLGFEVRVCPVVRLSSDLGKFKKGKELDAFLATCLRQGEGVDVSRLDVYRQWLQQRCDGAARLLQVDLKQLAQTRIFRRHQERQGPGGGRRGKVLERPEALLQGELEIVDAVAFHRLLARGIGRHKAFGFGMLRLRPPRRR
jgi:CRISPR system Cascade subunit CasE